ncbi:MAG TPA: hypothetical protein VM055_02985 [Novosphingobium sp.]|nr:hypothetical protein [Novosphingobium sp.]
MWDEGPLLSRNAISEAFRYDDALPPPLGLAALFGRLAAALREGLAQPRVAASSGSPVTG